MNDDAIWRKFFMQKFDSGAPYGRINVITQVELYFSQIAS